MDPGQHEWKRSRLALMALALVLVLVLVCVVIAGALWRGTRSRDAGPVVKPERPEKPAAATSGAPARATGTPPRPGRWKITVTSLTKVAPGQDPGPFVDEQCLSLEVPTPRGHVPPGCRSYEIKQAGAELTWRLRCTGSRQGDGTGRLTLAAGGERLEGQIRVWLPSLINGVPQRYDQTIQGERVGEACE